MSAWHRSMGFFWGGGYSTVLSFRDPCILSSWTPWKNMGFVRIFFLLFWMLFTSCFRTEQRFNVLYRSSVLIAALCCIMCFGWSAKESRERHNLDHSLSSVTFCFYLGILKLHITNLYNCITIYIYIYYTIVLPLWTGILLLQQCPPYTRIQLL